MFSLRLAVSTGGGIAERREKFKGKKGDEGGDPLSFVGRKTSLQFGKNFCARQELGLFTTLNWLRSGPSNGSGLGPGDLHG